jgi:hypothetical protein
MLYLTIICIIIFAIVLVLPIGTAFGNILVGEELLVVVNKFRREL